MLAEMGSSAADFERARSRLAEYLARHQLKHTRQRDAILQALLDAEGHVSSEHLYERVRAEHPEIGAATVYRTLKLLCEAGVANAIQSTEGVTLYERQHAHHDHLICVGCGEILEFESPVIEREQERVALERGYRLTHHRHHLFGHCASCQQKGREAGKEPLSN